MAQTSQGGRVVTLVAVSQGNVWVANAGGPAWGMAANTTGHTLNTTGVVRSAVNNQKLWFADGAHYLYYDPSQNAVLNWTASAGTLPADTDGNAPTLICTWRGRTVLSGLLKDGQNWFMSKVNDPTNFDYAPFPYVVTAAVAGNNSPLGLIGDVITSLVPYNDDILIFGGDHTLWQCAGDPANSGQILLISDAIGMAFGAPWAKDPYGTLYFVSNKTGIYALTPGQGAPQRVSQPVEQLLSGVDTGSNLVRLQWDDVWQGLHVYITPAASAQAATHLFYEQRTGAWWQDGFGNNNHNPLCCVTFDGNTPGDRHCLIGSWDGWVRQFDPQATTDDGTAVSSSVMIGPLLTQDLDMMLLKDIQGVLGHQSGSVTWAVYVGATPELALASATVATGTFSADRNYSSPARWSGHAIYVKITSSNRWAMETIRARLQTQGKVQRRGL